MKRYETYKYSDVEWIGEIPAEWQTKNLKYLGEVTLGKMLCPEDKGGYVLKPYLKSKNIGRGKLSLSTVDEMWFSPFELNSYRLEKEDILLSEGGEVGKTALWNNELDECYIQNSVHRIRIDKNNYNRYFYYYLTHLEASGFYKSIVSQVSIAHLTKEKLVKVPCVVPTKSEQICVASYLDNKTIRIDQIIQQKELLLEKLQAKRQAIINEAVTKGLNPNVPMKPSGIEWLGNIPEHWEVKKIRYEIEVLTDFTANGSFASLAENVEYLDEGYSRLVRLTDLREDLSNRGIYVNESAHKYLSKSELYGGEILLANVGAYAGLAWLMPNINYPATLGPNMFLLRFKNSTDKEFAYYSLISEYLNSQLKQKAISAAQPKLNKENVRSCVYVCPPIKEQKQIVEAIKIKNQKLDTLVNTLKVQIEKLIQYRQSLISEVVTGKIKVV